MNGNALLMEDKLGGTRQAVFHSLDDERSEMREFSVDIINCTVAF